MMLEMTQYSTNPLKKVTLMTTKKIGIIHSIIRCVLCWLGSALGIMDIFCCTHMVTPDRTGSTKVGSFSPKSSQRKARSTGAAPAIGSQL